MRVRLRDMPTKEELDVLYAKPHNHTNWVDHKFRADVTVAIGRHLPLSDEGYVADLSCGNGYIAREIAKCTQSSVILGDYAPGYAHMGPIEETINDLGGVIDLFVCSETLEHLDNPEEVLTKIRQKSDFLLLSTPEGEKDDSNPEHIWAWESEDVAMMLERTGWNPLIHNVLDLRPAGFLYAYQIWACG